MLVWLLSWLEGLTSSDANGAGSRSARQDHLSRGAGRRSQLRRGAGLGLADDRLVEPPLSRADHERLARTRPCIKTNNGRRRWADCFSSPACSAATVLLGDLAQPLCADHPRHAHGTRLARGPPTIWSSFGPRKGLRPRTKLAGQSFAGVRCRAFAVWRAAAAAGRLGFRRPLGRPRWRTRLAVRAVGDGSDRRLVERGESHRWSRWPGRRLPAFRDVCDRGPSLMPLDMPNGPPI